jgi:hypothetical protein
MTPKQKGRAYQVFIGLLYSFVEGQSLSETLLLHTLIFGSVLVIKRGKVLPNFSDQNLKITTFFYLHQP